ncbi:MAG: hypothetical protein AAFV38_02215 [Pseudomonadota bacterium]
MAGELIEVCAFANELPSITMSQQAAFGEHFAEAWVENMPQGCQTCGQCHAEGGTGKRGVRAGARSPNSLGSGQADGRNIVGHRFEQILNGAVAKDEFIIVDIKHPGGSERVIREPGDGAGPFPIPGIWRAV